jgi:hypothetical protein
LTPIDTVPPSNHRAATLRPRPARPDPLPRELRPGDVVRVRSHAEILATLDASGRLDGLPFMPEMLRFCGQTFGVYRRADKTCNTIGPGEHRRLHDTVHLEGLRCGGEAHGGCQAACLLYWKERWLEPLGVIDPSSTADASSVTGAPATMAAQADAVAATPPVSLLPAVSSSIDELAARTRADDGQPETEPVYTCQATEVVRASTVLPWWDVRQYARDVRTGNAGPLEVVVGLAKWLFVAVQQRLTGSTVPFLHGRLAVTPRIVSGLQAGDRVRVKTKREIEATLDARNRNHGLSFDAEMLRYCGREMRVLKRVERLIDERTGKMRSIPNDCLILDGAICTSEYHRFCPRSIFPYWREVWLTKIEGPSPEERSGWVAVPSASRPR